MRSLVFQLLRMQVLREEPVKISNPHTKPWVAHLDVNGPPTDSFRTSGQSLDVAFVRSDDVADMHITSDTGTD